MAHPEAQWPIERLDLFVGHYTSGTDVNANGGEIGTWPVNGFGGALRINAYIAAPSRPGGEPTEHFDVLVYHNYPWVDNHEANLVYGDKWRHQNLPPHSPIRWQILQSELRTLKDEVGLHRIFVQVKGRESGNFLTQERFFDKLPEN